MVSIRNEPTLDGASSVVDISFPFSLSLSLSSRHEFPSSIVDRIPPVRREGESKREERETLSFPFELPLRRPNVAIG